MTISGVMLLVIATASGIFLGLKQNQKLVQNENKMMLRRNGELLIHQNIRTFVESLGFDEREYRLSIESELDHQKVSFGKLDRTDLIQCSSEFYFQYQVELCRPPPISWPTIAIIFSIFAALIAVVALVVRRLGTEIVVSFQDLFRLAQIRAPEKMNFNQVWTTAFSMAQSFKDFQAKLLEAEKNRTIVDLSRQVAHDIRSPLTALNFLAASLDEVAPEKRNLAQQAIKRIDDIANELLQKAKTTLTEPLDLMPTMRQVVAEKKIEFQNQAQLLIELNSEETEAFANFSTSEFARILSNLVNNSVEAKSKSIRLSLLRLSKEIEITVSDDGGGIDPDHLGKVGEANFSFGKNGNGLGLSHAKSSVESANGQLTITSTPKQGTQIKILLPRV